MEKFFKSQTYGRCTFDQMMRHITDKIKSNPQMDYLLAIGTDSQNHRKDTKFASIVMLHTISKGGIFFCQENTQARIKVVKHRMLEEAHQSIDIASEILEWITHAYENDIFDFTQYNIKLEIHCDLGPNGDSNTAIKDALGWIQAEFGDAVVGVIKPKSAAASHIADRYTK